MSKGGGDQTTVQKADPWSGQQPYLKQGFQQAQYNFNNPPQFYPNATYIPFSGQTERALGMLENMGPSAVGSQMQDWSVRNMMNPGGDMAGNTGNYLNSVMQGNFLNGNPYLDKTFGAASRAVTDAWKDTVLPGINSSFVGAGGSGSGIQRELALDSADVLGRNLNELATNIYGGAYAQERGLQNQAAGMSNQLTGIRGDIARGAAALAPQADMFRYQPVNDLMRVGGMVEGKAGEVLGDSMNRFNYYQNLPDQQLANYISAIQGNYGGTTTNTQDISGNPWAGALGGGLTGLTLGGALASQFPNALGGNLLAGLGLGPLAGIGGAILGGLLS